MGVAGLKLASWFLCTLMVDAFKLLDVGPPRTGTQTMHEVMKILGLKPLHTGYEAESVRPALCGYLFGNDSLDDALAVFGGYDAAMDEPVMLMYEEIMAAFPEAKFLLTISDAESWFENYVELSRELRATGTISSKAFFHSLPRNCSQMQSWGCNFANPSPEDKDTCLKSYHRHIQRVQDVIPPERLLVYNWSDGWSALSHFLGTRIPEEQFPHEDLVKRNAESHIEERLKA